MPRQQAVTKYDKEIKTLKDQLRKAKLGRKSAVKDLRESQHSKVWHNLLQKEKLAVVGLLDRGFTKESLMEMVETKIAEFNGGGTDEERYKQVLRSADPDFAALLDIEDWEDNENMKGDGDMSNSA